MNIAKRLFIRVAGTAPVYSFEKCRRSSGREAIVHSDKGNSPGLVL